MKTYKTKIGGGLVKAVQLTEALTKDPQALAKMPSGFKVLSRVSATKERFAFRGQRGKIGDWLVVSERQGSSFYNPESFESYFERADSPLVEEKPRAHDWVEDWHDENGQYENQCLECNAIFIGHKHRHTCKVCTLKNLQALAEKQEPHPKQAVTEFEMAVRKLIAEQMQKGLTITEAVGTLHLFAADITNQLFNPPPTGADAINQ